ncbi:Glycosyltransferase involved in cell wall bisynthesis [Lachnospiraceae bacterium]|nr:Glycosyltransferase involved in cell wall bisynthesis [Lachnospiraceae bacterium]
MKTLTFFSNYFNHHQEALCNAFYSLLGDGFTFVETEPMEQFRSDMGWGRKAPSYVLKSYESDENLKKAYELGEKSDVVIMGTAPEDMIAKRMELNKLTFRYSERPLKEGRIKVFIPRLAKKFYHNHYQNRDKNLYLLAASAYCASDYKFMHSYIGKCYKFGYFPTAEKKSFAELTELKKKNKPVKILWAGRFLRLKRADLLIRAAKRCRDEGYDFRLEFVGDGVEEKRLMKLVRELKLDDITEFKGFLSPEETRTEMEKANIFVMTSNFLEGWGSVIYEGLSAGCAVIASHAAGATPFLVSQGRTGFVFKSGDEDSLTDKLLTLLKSPETAQELGRAAYQNMQTYWNPEVAASRIVEMSDAMLSGSMKNYEEGPLSPCSYLYNNWYRER